MDITEDITQPKIILVEGIDEVYFFESLFECMDISDVQIINIKGKDNFKDEIPALKVRPGFKNVNTIGIIRDADNSEKSAFQSIKDILRNSGLHAPSQKGLFSNGTPAIGIYIMPGTCEEGMLENLCLDSVKEDPCFECVTKFFECVSEKCTSNNIEKPRNPHKARAQVYLATKNKIVNSVGLGAKKGYWNFESDAMMPIKDFLEHFK